MSGRATRVFNGSIVQWRSIDTRKFIISCFSRTIAELGLMDYQDVERVLELGSGNGLNILALAALHPEVKTWRGIELTPQGVTSATSLLANPPLKYLRYVTGLGAEIIRDRLGGADIQFQEGNILNLPFPDGSFDVVYSCQVIEQLPRDYRRAFEEARRVTSKYAFFLEEFLEAQNIFHRMHLRNVDYFCASFQEVEKAGFRVFKFEPFPLRPLYYSLGLLICSTR